MEREKWIMVIERGCALVVKKNKKEMVHWHDTYNKRPEKQTRKEKQSC